MLHFFAYVFVASASAMSQCLPSFIHIQGRKQLLQMRIFQLSLEIQPGHLLLVNPTKTLQLCTRLKEVIEKLESYISQISLLDSISRKPGEGPTELGTLNFLNFCSCVTLSASKKSSPTSCSRKRRFSSCPFCRAESTKIPVRIFLGNERHRPPSTKLDSTGTPAKACVSRQAD